MLDSCHIWGVVFRSNVMHIINEWTGHNVKTLNWPCFDNYTFVFFHIWLVCIVSCILRSIRTM